MRSARRITTGAAIAAIAAGVPLACAQESEPPAATAAAGGSAGASAAPRDDPGRAQRLAAQRRAAETQLAAMEAFGEEERFLAALRAAVAEVPPEQEEAAPFRPVRTGLVPLGAFSSYVRWQTPRASRERPVAIDVELPNHPFQAIVDFDRQVRARGVDFLLVLVPTRLEIYPELVAELPAAARFAGMGAGTQRFLLALNERGVEAISLTGAFAAERRAQAPPPEQLFLRTDPHWTPRGAELAARAVADHVARFPWFRPGPLVEGRDFRVEPREFGYDPGESLVKRGSEVEPVVGSTVWSGDALLDALDKSAPIVVLGDSYVRLYSGTACDFCTQLCRFTGWKIDVIQSFGGAAEQVRRKLARREPAQWQGKRLIVWVVPETLLVPTEWWKPVPLGAP